jgi:hypothetical protein
MICMVIDGVITDHAGHVISLDELPAALANAEAKRQRVYSERAETFAESAWPKYAQRS